jgi:uncharacterized coiled-coil protein SlyX
MKNLVLFAALMAGFAPCNLVVAQETPPVGAAVYQDPSEAPAIVSTPAPRFAQANASARSGSVAPAPAAPPAPAPKPTASQPSQRENTESLVTPVADSPTGTALTEQASDYLGRPFRNGRMSSRSGRPSSRSDSRRVSRSNRNTSRAASPASGYNSSLEHRIRALEESDERQDKAIEEVQQDVGWLKNRVRDIRYLFYAKYGELNKAEQAQKKDISSLRTGIADLNANDQKLGTQIGSVGGTVVELDGEVASIGDSLAAVWKWAWVGIVILFVFACLFVLKGAKKAQEKVAAKRSARTGAPAVPPATTSH